MKKLLLLTLASFSSVCFGAIVRIGLITQSGETIYMIGDYYDERHNTIKTPFGYINVAINIQFMGQKGLMVKEVADQPGLLEYVHQVALPDADPAILRMAITLLTEPGHDIDHLDMPTIVQLITTCETLKTPPLIIDILLDKIVTLSINDPVLCPFAENSRKPLNTPTVFRDSVTIQNRELIAAARKNVAKIFAEEVLPASKWVEEEQFRHNDPISVAFSSNGKHLFIREWCHTACILDMQMHKQIRDAFMQDDSVYSVAFSLDDRYLATLSNDCAARIWDVQTRKQVGEPIRHNASVHSLAFSPDGKYLATGVGTTVRIWNVQTHEQMGEPFEHNHDIYSILFSPDNKYLATGAANNTVHIWDIQTHKQTGEPFMWDLTTNLAAFSPNSRHLAFCCGKYLRIFDVQTHKQIGEPFKHSDYLASVTFSPDGKYLATGSFDHTMRI